MPNPYSDETVPLNMVVRAANICRDALQRHNRLLRNQGVDDLVDVENVLVNNAIAIRDQGQAAWSTIWNARDDLMTPADAVRAWRDALSEWAMTNLIG